MGLSTHILDTMLGRPAPGIPVALSAERSGTWQHICSAVTDADGRCGSLLAGVALGRNTYRLRFEVSGYFAQQAMASLYPYVEITFTVSDPEQHHHIPLLLAANGYTTYRGS